ncbi:FAD-dependent monooxygenase [soil metagenome]
MQPRSHFDVVVVGGGIAGSCLGGILARAGLSILIVEKDASFRDRVRGEITWPWGVAEVERAGLRAVLEHADCVEIEAIRFIDERQVKDVYEFAPDSIDGLPALGFSHPRLQQAALDWAGSQGATVLRPAKATQFEQDNSPVVTVVRDGEELKVRTRLVVGADGKQSGVRQWTGGEAESDPERHRLGGVLVRGIQWDRRTLDIVGFPQMTVFWFSASRDSTRVYVAAKRDCLRVLGLERSFENLAGQLAAIMPEDAFAQLHQAGPIGFFPNQNVWSTKLASDYVVLIGDAAGASDPSRGMGTSQVFQDVRELSDLLLGERNWPKALAEFERRRWRSYHVIREHDRWRSLLVFEVGKEADQRRERHLRARENDPTLGGFALLESRGPDGLVANEAARRRFFGEDLP